MSINRLEFLQRRRLGIYSTDTPAIMNLYPPGWKKTPMSVYLDKTAVTGAEESENHYLRDGLELEPFLMQRFTAETGISLYKVQDDHVHKEDSWLRAHIDCLSAVDPNVLVELKTTSPRNFETWEKSLPYHVHVQVMHQLAVMDLPSAFVFVWAYGQGTKIYEVTRDDKIIALIRAHAKSFWHDHVLAQMPPLEFASSEDLKLIYASATAGKEIELPKDLTACIETWDLAQKTVESGEAMKEEVKKTLMKYLKDAEVGKLGDRIVRWTNCNQTRLDGAKLKKDHEELYKQYTKESSYRRFTINGGDDGKGE